MPKVAGLNVVAILLGALAFFFIGFLLYGVIFGEEWMRWQGATEAEIEAAKQASPEPMVMVIGYLLNVVLVTGLAVTLNWNNISTVGTAVKRALIIGLVFGGAISAFQWNYGDAAIQIWILDTVHLTLGLVAAGAILAAMDNGKAD